MSKVIGSAVFNTSLIKNTPVKVIADGYTAGGMSIRLIHEDTGEPIATISVWVEGVTPNLPQGWFVCKSYSENEGVEAWLLESGLCVWVCDTNVPVGFATCHVLKLSKKLMYELIGHEPVEVQEVENPDERG